MKVSKVDATRRQLDSAIKLWFEDGDVVSIHTLVFSAFEILNDLNRKQGNHDVTLAGLVKRNYEPEHVETVIALIKKPMTFFKHANRDPYDVLEFEPKNIEKLIMISLLGLNALGERISATQNAFVNWFLLHNPHLYKPGVEPITKKLDADKIQRLKLISKGEFLKTFLLVSAKAGRI